MESDHIAPWAQRLDDNDIQFSLDYLSESGFTILTRRSAYASLKLGRPFVLNEMKAYCRTRLSLPPLS